MREYITKEQAMRRFKPFGREIPKDVVIGVIASVKEDIVRCKDCKHRYTFATNETGTATHYYVCDFMDAQYEDEGYCHHGERRENE